MKLFLVGFDNTLKIVKKFIMKHYADIQFGMYSTMLDVRELTEQIRYAEKEYDGILFTGRTPYDIAIAHMVPEKPWIFIRRQEAQLLRILLEAAVMKKLDIRKISIDQLSLAIFEPNFLEQTLRQIGVKPSELQLYYIDADPAENNLIDSFARKHEELYRSHSVSFCLTSLSSVEKILLQRRVPVLRIPFDENSIDDAIAKLRLLHLQYTQDGQTPVSMAMIEVKNDAETFEGATRHRASLLARMEILDEIFAIGNRMGGALIETGYNQFCLVFYHKKDNFYFEDVPHLVKAAQQKDVRINIGMGIHENLRQCRQYALRALEACRQAKTGAAFLCDQEGRCLGPLHPASVYEQPTGPILYSDELAQTISVQTGIHAKAIESIFKLNISKKDGEFSSHDFANILGISTRNANRLLMLLEEQNIIQLVGKRTYPGGGRPIRIFHLCL